MGTMIFQIIYAVSLGLAVLTLIGVVLMTFCDKYKCRYLMYFACVFMFLFAFIGFLIAFFFSIIIPIMYWGCDWLSVTVGSGTGFTINISPLLDATTAGYITPCLEGGNGDIISAVAPTVAGTLNSLSETVKNSTNFNFTDKTTDIDAVLLNITNTIADFVSGKNPDLADVTQLAKLTRIAQSSNSAFLPCSTLVTDSWAVSSD
jgi:hypothetical protein